MNKFMEMVGKRRSIYGISNEEIVSRDDLEAIVEAAVKDAPTAFNMQSGRVVLLFGDEHLKLWNIVKETLRAIVPAEHFAATDEKINNFANGYATVLFFDDKNVIHHMEEQVKDYAQNFEPWSQHAAGMLQYIIWTAVSNEGLGASLQHYNPLIDAEVAKTWNIPEGWKLLAQMPIGKAIAAPNEKVINPVDDRMKVYGK